MAGGQQGQQAQQSLRGVGHVPIIAQIRTVTVRICR
jgi:hypothetical protein